MHYVAAKIIPLPPPCSLSKSHILGSPTVYLRIIYVYLILTQWVRSGVRCQSSELGGLPVHYCGCKFGLCQTCSAGELLGAKKQKKKEEKGRALRGELLYGWLVCELTQLINWMTLHKLDSPSALEEKQNVDTRMHILCQE